MTDPRRGAAGAGASPQDAELEELVRASHHEARDAADGTPGTPDSEGGYAGYAAGYDAGTEELAAGAPGGASGEDPGYDDDDEAWEGSQLDAAAWLKSNWYLPAAGLLVVVLMLAMGVKLLGGGGGEEAPGQEAAAVQEAAQQEQQQEQGGAAQGAQGAQGTQDTRDTGVVIEPPVTEDGGAYYLKSGEVAWKGKLKAADDGEVLTLEGPTAAQFRRAITLKDAQIDTGTFGRAEPEGPMVHVMYHRASAGGKEFTGGTYFVVDGPAVVLQGSYTDAREPGTEQITRTYTQSDPQKPEASRESFSVTFEAAPGVPVPALVGWEPPEGGAAGDGDTETVAEPG